MKTDDRFEHLPGGPLLREGLSDLENGRHTAPACLVEMARGRLAEAGLLPARTSPRPGEWELELYRLLRAEGGDAYSRYNALVRELTSFTYALERSGKSRA
jgi:hypothetical protein